VIQVDVGDQAHLKLISISESLSPIEKQDLLSLIQEDVDVFAWSYEDMPGHDPQVAMHHLNIKPDAKLVKQQQRQFRPDIMEAIKNWIHKLIECSLIREEHHPDWVANIVHVLKKMERSESASSSVISTQPA